MNNIVERRLALWPNAKTRAEAAQLLYVKGWELGRVLALYPDEVVSEDRGVSRGAARRAIWAHYSLLQEAVGEPDIVRCGLPLTRSLGTGQVTGSHRSSERPPEPLAEAPASSAGVPVGVWSCASSFL